VAGKLMTRVSSCIFASILCLISASTGAAQNGGTLEAPLASLAHEYYQWRDAAYPVATSAAGDHRADDRLTDYRMSEVQKRREHVSALLAQVRAMQVSGWSKDARIDRILEPRP